MVDKPTVISGMVVSVSGFIETIRKLPIVEDGFYTFRGEANIEWPRHPSIMRPQFAKLLEYERDATRDIISVHPHEFDSDRTMFDRLVRMQHFGLPTRLMDVTGNPLVALFNASEPHINNAGNETDGQLYYISVPRERRKYFDGDTVSVISNLCNMTSREKAILLDHRHDTIADFNNTKKNPTADRLLQFIREEKPSFRSIINPKDLDRLYYVIPKLSNRRIIAQNGAFMLFGLTNEPRRPAGSDRISFRSLRVPEEKKREIRADLATLGITESALFPEIDKAAAFIKARYS